MKKKFKIPVVWSEMGVMEIEAENLDKAIQKAWFKDTPLPKGEYLEDSFEIDEEAIPLYNIEQVL